MKKFENYRKSVFIVVYRKTEKGILYLILKRKLHWSGWEFPKGGIEPDEKIEETIKRELKEETGQFPLIIQKHNFSGKYKYKNKVAGRWFVGQMFSLYSVEVKNEEIILDKREHSEYLWLPYFEAHRKLTYRNQKKSLEIVNDFFGSEGIFSREKISQFRNFRTTSGKLVLAGKDAKNNEELIVQVQPDEFVFHTEKPGSPFVNIKAKTGNFFINSSSKKSQIKDENPSQEDIKESAIFCAVKSQDWRDNKKDVQVNLFKGKDIYKTKEMKIGTFGVKNKKTILIKKYEIEEFLKNVN